MPSAKEANAVTLLKADHRKVEALFERYAATEDSSEKEKLVKEICTELCIHATLEEEIFYPACSGQIEDQTLIDESYVEHDGAKVLISELLNSGPDAGFYDAKVSVLEEMIKHHVSEEERPGEGVFDQAQTADLDMKTLGEQLLARKAELATEFKQGTELPPPETRSFTGHELRQGTPVSDKTLAAP
jgi:hypothetical protein